VIQAHREKRIQPFRSPAQAAARTPPPLKLPLLLKPALPFPLGLTLLPFERGNLLLKPL